MVVALLLNKFGAMAEFTDLTANGNLMCVLPNFNKRNSSIFRKNDLSNLISKCAEIKC